MKNSEKYFEGPIFMYSRARGFFFTAQFAALNWISLFLPGQKKFLKNFDREKIKTVDRSMLDLLKEDAANIANGVYPLSVLKPEPPLQHIKRIPGILIDGLSIYYRRIAGKTTIFDKKALESLQELPRYYRRNFHFQTDGYLSKASAQLYEHQVELLFHGAADAMRRMIIVSLREKFGNTDGNGLHFLELACGTGRATKFVALAFPKAKITAIDLSSSYLKEAALKLDSFEKVHFLQADAAELPFKEENFDAIYSVFLFHELPFDVREKVMLESKRVLKKDGFLGFVDSLQKTDNPDLNIFLENFPASYHEPFFRNYIENPMEKIFKKMNLKKIKTKKGFFSKVCWSDK